MFNEKEKRILRKKTSFGQRLLRFVVGQVEKWQQRFLTFHERPLYAKQIRFVPPGRSYREHAIVLQGPILHAHDFTLETIRLYRKYYPDAALVFSTWQWEARDAATIEAARAEGAHIVLNKKFEFPGLDKKYVNLNLQILSSRAGVSYAREFGARWVLKTRTDQRMYSPSALDLLRDIANTFPLSGSSGQQRCRIIALNRGKSWPKLYHLVDWLIFGSVEDVALYWSADVLATIPRAPHTASGILSAEAYLFTEFLKKVGYTMQWTKDDSLRAFAERCVIIDQPMLDFYWRKYEFHREYRFVNYYTIRPRSFGFAEWLSAYRATCSSDREHDKNVDTSNTSLFASPAHIHCLTFDCDIGHRRVGNDCPEEEV